jgi:hypothetical protein
MDTPFLRLSVIAKDTRITCWEWATMFGSIEYLAISSSHSSREGILSRTQKGSDIFSIQLPITKFKSTAINRREISDYHFKYFIH